MEFISSSSTFVGMSDTLLLSSLMRKRAYLAGEIEQAQRIVRKKQSDLKAIDRMLRLLDEGIKPGEIKGIRRHRRMESFRQGELTRLTFEILRVAQNPLTAKQIAMEAANRKKLALSADLLGRLRHNLYRLAREGKVRTVGPRRAFRWTL
jgi:hypothetical protein